MTLLGAVSTGDLSINLISPRNLIIYNKESAAVFDLDNVIVTILLT